jgi:hypothetical protein
VQRDGSGSSSIVCSFGQPHLTMGALQTLLRCCRSSLKKLCCPDSRAAVFQTVLRPSPQPVMHRKRAIAAVLSTTSSTKPRPHTP